MKPRVERFALNSCNGQRRNRRKIEGHLSKTVGSQTQNRNCGCV